MLRAVVDAATRRVTRALEPLVRPGAALPGGAASLTELVAAAEHLEHFHEYVPSALSHMSAVGPAYTSLVLQVIASSRTIFIWRFSVT